MDESLNKSALGQKIKILRNSLGLTQENFCNAINLEVSNLSNIENGKNFPSIQTIYKIITKFKIEPNDLLGIDFYNNEEIVKELTFEYFNKLPFDKKIMVMKMIMLINENDKNN